MTNRTEMRDLRQSAQLTDGTTVEISDRDYLTRTDGETVLVGVRTKAGRYVAANRVAWIGWA